MTLNALNLLGGQSALRRECEFSALSIVNFLGVYGAARIGDSPLELLSCVLLL